MIGGPTVVYGLCLATSLICAALLVRSFLRTRAKLLMWSALCFSFLALNNLFVVLDMIVLPTTDLTWPRQLTSFAAISVLLYGFVWETDR